MEEAGLDVAAPEVIPEPSSPTQSNAPAEVSDESFGGFAWQENDEIPPAAVTPAAPPPAASPAAPPSGTTSDTVSVADYKVLLQENFELRKKVTEVTAEKAAAEKQRQDSDQRIRDMERSALESATKIESLQKSKDALSESLAKGAAAPAPPDRAPETAAQPGSDLFRRMDQENLSLRQKLAVVEAEKDKALQAQGEMLKEHKAVVEKKKALEEQLGKLALSEKDQKKTVGNLLDRMPKMENDLADLQKKILEKDSALMKKDHDLLTLKEEFSQRENRLIKAERMAALMDRTREEVKKVTEKEARDMHFNMAAVYAKEGRYREAEEEYLSALKVDPTDADSHYNVAILYDEEFHDQRRASMHYRRYLKLRPNAPDVDIVKEWLLNLETGGKRPGAAESS